MTHTPGPWKAVGQAVYAETPQDIDHSRHHGYDEREPDGFLIAESIPHEATARLIAAAPDLLAALEQVAEWAARHDTVEGTGALFAFALATIAKARGE
jgi:hypothetical protein